MEFKLLAEEMVSVDNSLPPPPSKTPIRHIIPSSTFPSGYLQLLSRGNYVFPFQDLGLSQKNVVLCAIVFFWSGFEYCLSKVWLYDLMLTFLCPVMNEMMIRS